MMSGAKYSVCDDDHNHRRVAAQSVDSPPLVEVSCSICLELVVDDGTRSRAKLQCGHQFHLDCIGSAFNTKGAMQCPNCRNVEMGQWLYANGSTRAFPEFVMEDWIPEEDLYGFSYPQLQYRVRWCPFGELSQAINVQQGSSTQMREHFHTQHHIFNNQRQHHTIGPNLRGFPPPPPLMPDQNIRFFIYPPPNSSGGHREPETDHFHAWERDWFPHFPVPSNHRAISSFWHRRF